MQDINSSNIATVLSTLEEDEPYFLRDRRDNQPYCVAKLKDGKLWMTENLNIAGGTALSSADTDFDASYTLPTTDGWTVPDGKLILPASAVKNENDNNLTDGTQFSANDYAYVFNSGNKENCGAKDQDIPCYSYYSWDTATLGSGRSIDTSNTDANYSICPKNWRLPIARYTHTFDATIAVESDFYNLVTSYGVPTGAWSQLTSNFYNRAGPSTTPDFLLAGCYTGGSFYYGGYTGEYWSATSASRYTYAAQHLLFYTGNVYSAESDTRKFGYPVRCLFGSQSLPLSGL